MPVLKPADLPSAWTNWSAMSRDKAPSGDPEGVLTRSELKSLLQDLNDAKTSASSSHEPTMYLDMQINSGRKLYKDMVDAGATGLQYVPDELMSLPIALRRRATELLKRDDTSMLGQVDQFVIDHARGRYNAMTAMSSGMVQAKETALNEIDDLADALGLE